MQDTSRIHETVAYFRRQRGWINGYATSTTVATISHQAETARRRRWLPIKRTDRAVRQGVSNLIARSLHVTFAFSLDQLDKLNETNPLSVPLRKIRHHAPPLGAIRSMAASAAGAVPAFGPSA